MQSDIPSHKADNTLSQFATEVSGMCGEANCWLDGNRKSDAQPMRMLAFTMSERAHVVRIVCARQPYLLKRASVQPLRDTKAGQYSV